MVDKKVYKTDYESDFTQFFKQADVEVNNPAVDEEKDKYDRVFELRDQPKTKTNRLKLWENF